MFSEGSILKDVNIINKIICCFIVILSLIICTESIFLIFINLFLLLITKQYHKLFITTIINTIILIICMFFPQFLWITKLITLIIYIILLKKVTKATELRYLIEKTLYRFQNKKITYRILYFLYFVKVYRKNINKLFILKDNYKIKLNYNFIVFILKKAYKKTKIELNNLMEINKLRFYNYTKERTYIEKPKWETWDTSYIISHIIILLFTVFYGR